MECFKYMWIKKSLAFDISFSAIIRNFRPHNELSVLDENLTSAWILAACLSPGL